MSTHNIQFHDKNKEKNPCIFVFLSYWNNFVGTEKRVRFIHGKRAIRVRAIEVILYKDKYNKELRCQTTYSKTVDYLGRA